MTRFATLRLVWAAILIACATDVVACTCGDRTLATRYDTAVHVFTAVIVDERIESADQRAPVRSAFGITERFKGGPPFVELASHRSGASCGIALMVGVEYLFFAPDSGEIGQCSVVRRDRADLQIAALRSFVGGASPDLAEPWLFFGPSTDGCSLLTTFDVAETDELGHLAISTSKWRATQGFDAVELTIRGGRIPHGRDPDPRPLRLAVDDTAYSAAWTTGRVAHQATIPPRTSELPDSYLLAGQGVEALLSELTMARALLVRYDSNGFGPSRDLEVRTTNIGDAGFKMLNCIRDQRSPGVEPQ